MNKPTKNEWEEAERFISFRVDGAIVYQSVLERRWPGRLDVLLSCVEDNGIEDGEGNECIDWSAVQRDYESATQ